MEPYRGPECQCGVPGCKREGVVYQLKCQQCGDLYIGETSRPLHSRIKEHKTAYTNKTKTSTLYKHATEKQHDTVDITTKILCQYKDDPMRRQLGEAVYYRAAARNPTITTMNTQTEWNCTANRIPEIEIHNTDRW